VIVLADFFSRGGPVLYAVFAAALLLWAMISHRLWFFYGQRHVLVSDLEQRWLAYRPHQRTSASDPRSLDQPLSRAGVVWSALNRRADRRLPFAGTAWHRNGDDSGI